MEIPRISIITVNLNNAPGLKKTLESIRIQSFPHFECIVIDGASGDGSQNLIEAYGTLITQFVSEKDTGIYNAQNKGIQQAKGEYCLFLNSGDILADQNVLKEVAGYLKEVDILYGDLITSDMQGTRTFLKSPEKVDVPYFMVSTLWHPTAFIKRSLFEKIGPYREEFKVAGDYEFFIRAILKNNASTKHLSLPIAVFDLGGISNNPSARELQSIERKKSWELNFSPLMINAFENYTRLLRSSEYKWGLFIKKIVKPFSSHK